MCKHDLVANDGRLDTKKRHGISQVIYYCARMHYKCNWYCFWRLTSNIFMSYPWKSCHSNESSVCIIDLKHYEHFVFKIYINHIFEIFFNLPVSSVTKVTRGLTATARLLNNKEILKETQVISKYSFSGTGNKIKHIRCDSINILTSINMALSTT